MKEYTSDIKPDNKALKKLVKQFAKKHMPNKQSHYRLIKNGGIYPKGAMPRSQCKAELFGELQYVVDGRQSHIAVTAIGLEIKSLANHWEVVFRAEMLTP
jgi:hypothetical protein